MMHNQKNNLLVVLFLLIVPFIFPHPTQAASTGCNYGLVDSITTKFIISTIGGVEGYSCPMDEQLSSERDQSFSSAVHIGGGGGENGTNFTNQSLNHNLNSAIASLYQNPPASAGYYVADLIHSINPTNQAYAQNGPGLGFASLSPILGIWKAVRNVSYFLFTLVFVAIGFAIMFRAKLSAQTVVSIETALPRLVMTLLLITFSYAIAGLMIDLMYLIIYLILAICDLYLFPNQFGNLETVALGNNIFDNVLQGFILSPSGGGLRSVAEAVAGVVQNVLNDVVGNFIGDVLSGGLGVIAWAVFAGAIVINSFRVFFKLLITQFKLLVEIAFSPIILLPTAFPGNDAIIKWTRGIAGKLSVYPTAIIVILFAYYLAGGGGSGDSALAPALVHTQEANFPNQAYAQSTETSGFTGFAPPQTGLQGLGNYAPTLLSFIAMLAMIDILGTVENTVGGSGGGAGGGGGGGLFGSFAGGAAGGALGAALNPLKRVGGLATGIGGNIVGGYVNDKIGSLPMIRSFHRLQAKRDVKRNLARGMYSPEQEAAIRERYNLYDTPTKTRDALADSRSRAAVSTERAPVPDQSGRSPRQPTPGSGGQAIPT